MPAKMTAEAERAIERGMLAGATEAEMAELTGCSVSAVARAKSRIRKSWDDRASGRVEVRVHQLATLFSTQEQAYASKQHKYVIQCADKISRLLDLLPPEVIVNMQKPTAQASRIEFYDPKRRLVVRNGEDFEEAKRRFDIGDHHGLVLVDSNDNRVLRVDPDQPDAAELQEAFKQYLDFDGTTTQINVVSPPADFKNGEF